TATDGISPPAIAQIPLTIVGRLQILTTSLPQANVGQAYGARLQASGGLPPLNWSVSGLPQGLSFVAATGDIIGTPAAAGSVTLSVTANDAATQTATAQIPLTVVVPIPPLRILPGSLPSGVVGVVYPGANIGATGGSPNYTFTQAGGNFPPGLTLSPG